MADGIQMSCRLTTIDNPFDPFDEFDDWYRFDNDYGFNCLAYVDRVTNITDSMSEEEARAEYERGINEIIKNDFLNLFKKVSRDPDTLVEDTVGGPAK